MTRSLSLVLLVATALFASEEETNWSAVFENVTNHDTAIADAARGQIVGQLLPKVCKEEPDLASVDVTKIAGQLDRSEDMVRMQASAFLLVVSKCRSDSAEIVRPAFTALRIHVYDLQRRIGANSVNTLASLSPTIPDEELAFLIELTNGKQEVLALIATSGVARMADSRSAAADTMDRLLSSETPKPRRIAAIEAITTSRVNEPRLIAHLGTLLSDVTLIS